MRPAAASRWRRLLRASRALAVVSVALFAVAIARFWHPVYGFSALIQLDATNDDDKLAVFRELPVFVHRDTGGYDGLYYAQVAQDPSLRDPGLRRAMDNFAYRARRILPPAVAWAAGLGRPAWIVQTYAALNLAAWLALAVVLWRILAVADLRGWAAWAGVLFSAGALGSVRLALTDLPATLLLALGVWAAERWRGRLAVAVIAAAALARETALLGVAGLVKPPWWSAKNAARLALVAAPLALWLAYVRWRVGPADQGWANFTWPVLGLVGKLGADTAALRTVADHPLAWTTLLSTVGLVTQAAYFAVRRAPAERWWRIGLVFTGLLLGLGTAVWEGFPGAATRVLLPLTLAFNVLAHRRRAGFAWLVLGNLGVFAGLLMLRDVPADPREIAAARASGVGVVARVGEGWFGRETTGRHTWFWSGGRGSIELEAWPKTAASIALEFALRSPDARAVALRAGGRELASFEADAAPRQHTVIVPLEHGRATIEFTSAAPPVRESASPTARALSFALYDPRLAAPTR